MLFVASGPGVQQSFQGLNEYPYVSLRHDNWDDFGYKSLFMVRYYRTPDDLVELGATKIIARGRDGFTPLASMFRALPEEYCSLGQDLSFYEALARLRRDIAVEILTALRDAAYDRSIRILFENEIGFHKSLIRQGGALSALRDGAAFLTPLGLDRASPIPLGDAVKLNFRFATSVGGSTFEADFAFNDSAQLPSRINAIIGYNGTGKTQLLANLAKVADAGPSVRAGENFALQNGSFDRLNAEIAFGATITVSYSAFDTFELPGKGSWGQADQVEKKGQVFGYVYCGLRMPMRYEEDDGLKGPRQIEAELVQAITEARSERRREPYLKALAPLIAEPSFARVQLSDMILLGEKSLSSQLRHLSTGHKIVLTIVTRLAAHLQDRSLVLIDEPESHLHPPLLAAMLRSVQGLLGEYNSVAVVATHSPVVLQEIPSRYVKILERYDEFTRCRAPAAETFGDNIGSLTRYVFNLDNSQADYHSVLEDLALRMPLDEIERRFGKTLNAPARAHIVSFLASVEDE